ncbi:hypothetical protein ACFPQ7_14625 [Methylobacterium iners]|uniref:General secretion pathway protein GspK n=1 Tax=Methylobacterium iners TaxID=418707 RepID=A0ABQ4S7H9_9HYPH|nr:hypothetical protein OCOJLMKI_5068 [Methylobacterium iners]
MRYRRKQTPGFAALLALLIVSVLGGAFIVIHQTLAEARMLQAARVSGKTS